MTLAYDPDAVMTVQKHTAPLTIAVGPPAPSRLKIIYIAGPYRAPSEWNVRMNIREAEHYALFVWQHGAVALCPHKNTSGFGGAPDTHDQTWLTGDLELLKRCDALWAIPGWTGSSGAQAEVQFAEKHNIPCLFSTRDVLDFINQKSTPEIWCKYEME